MRLRGRLLSCAGAVVSAALLGSCVPPAEPGAPRSTVARQLDLLVSSANGYHYPPFLREQPAAPEQQFYALRTLSDLGREPRMRVSAQRVAELRREALASSPLWGRAWLVPLLRAGAGEALGAGDAQAVGKLRAKGGWYVDTALGQDGDAALLGATWAAVEVLDALGPEAAPSRADRSSTVRWLRSLARTPRPLDQSAALAGALRLLGSPVPTALTTTAPPRTDDWATLTPETRAQRLADTYYHVLVQEAAGRRPLLDRGIWEAVLRDGAATLPYEHLYYVVHVLKAAGAEDAVFAPVIRRLEGARLEDGTVRDPAAYPGNPDASLFVERLRTLAGRPRKDQRLLAALDRDERSGRASQEPAERLARAALRAVAAGGDPAGEEARRLCADPAVLPATVTEHNATLWHRTRLNCHDAGVRSRLPAVHRWATDTSQGVVAAATVAVGFADSGARDAVPQWITAESLKRWVRTPERFVSVYDYVLVVRAHALLGGVTDAALREALGRGVTPYRGCPGLPDLFQVGRGDRACDLKTTWGVWSLDHRLHDAMGWTPARIPATTEHTE